jgi:endonuclease YncB( thermonuclease family)
MCDTIVSQFRAKSRERIRRRRKTAKAGGALRDNEATVPSLAMSFRTFHRALLGTVLLLAVPATAVAETIVGVVASVSYGDTLAVIDQRGAAHRVRIAGIDAPEHGQAFSERSTLSLSEICLGKQAVIEQSTADRYGRVVGRVICVGIDAGAEQVRRGMAWAFDRYRDGAAFRRLQADARAAGRGLWVDAAPLPPWEWRALRRRLQEKP